MSLTNVAPHGIISMDVAKRGVLNEGMRRKSQGSSSHLKALFTEFGGEVKVKAPKIEVKARSSQGKIIRILSVIIVERKGTSRDFVIN